ncbi:MAG: dephospho-CoA kinase [Acidaminococcaceae bacterium]|nr:dephospho-CoA kinase [Acidaminococcaceae bacterium]
MKIIGLTGGIASGKSTVAQHIRQQGIPVFDADAVSKAVVAPGTEGLEKVIAVFGKEYLKDGGLDRKKIAEVVFNNKEKLKLLESIILTRVWQEAEQAIADAKKQNSPMIVLDVPLLIEKEWYKKVDEVWLVYISPEEQIRRVMLRDGMTREQAKARMANQMSTDEKRKYADVVIDNGGALEKTLAFVQKEIEKIRK